MLEHLNKWKDLDIWQDLHISLILDSSVKLTRYSITEVFGSIGHMLVSETY